MTLHPIQVLDHVLDEYEDYLRTEFRAKDEQLREALRMEIDRPLFLAQEPFYQAHRPFKSGKPWRELPLDPRLAKTMEKRSDSTTAFLHQSESIAHLLSPGATPVVVTTGTGSGKTECFLLPVIQNAIEDGSRFRKNGLTAILVYPMNALANDQIERIHEYLEDSGFTGVLKVEKYDRGTDQAKREEMRRNPPHLLLTNYVMLEYLLTRPADRDAIFANHRCRFLVLDEVHTYRGSLGSNIGLLVRRLRAHLRAAKQDWGTDIEADRERRFPKLVPIGTSATIKSLDEENLPRAEIVRRRDASVQGFFAALTGEAADSIRILGEELREVTPPPEARYPTPPPSVASFDVSDAEAVRRAVCALAGIRADRPLDEAARSARILWNLGAWLIHRPMSVPQIVQRLRETVPERRDVRADLVRAEVEAALAAGCALPEKTLGALRLRAHRFLRGGWSFYRCVSPECGRIFPMGEGTCACGRQAAPLYLCRACGASYLGFLEDTEGTGILRPGVGTKDTEWLLYDPARHEGGLSFEDEDDEEEDEEANGRRRRGARRQPAPGNRPTQVRGRRVREGSFDPRTLTFDEDQETYPMRAVLAPGRTRCMCCGSTAGSRSIITPVSLGTSAAVKVIGEGLVESLAEANRNREKHDGKERLLVFSDSRQDAAHQARFLIFAGRYDRMRRRVVSILQNEARRVLPLGRLVELLAGAARPGDNPFVPEGGFVSNEVRRKIEGWEEAPLLDDLALSASYRATLLNLGLVGVDYQGLADHTRSAGREIATSLGLTTEQLEHVCRALLDEMRRRGALNREMLTYHPMNLRCPEYARSAEWERRIKQPQGYACDERGRPTAFLDQNAVEYGIHVHNFWRRPGTGGRDPSFGRILKHLCARFAGATPTPEQAVGVVEFLRGFVMPTTLHGARESSQLIQVAADTVHLALLTEAERQRCGTCGAVQPFRRVGSPCMRCHGTLTAWRDGEVRESRTVRRILEPHTQPLVAREHTAQVPQAERADLESWFKQPPTESPVNVLACSPTLEMGIDVGGLDAVVLRNVPPRPDNYAQRGGRAGRRTRVGLVVGYTRNTPHDQYFFDKPEEMIAGEVPAPLVPLNNRDIILRHLASVAFGLADPGLAGRMIDYVTATGELNDEPIAALIQAVSAQAGAAVALCRQAWGAELLHAAGLDEGALNAHVAELPQRIRHVFESTARQVRELRSPLEAFAASLRGQNRGARSARMVAGLLGIPSDQFGRQQNENREADDRSAGYPLRRFAEFGILPGYEFPSEPATLRLLGDQHEEDVVSVARRFGIAQFQPDASVFARSKRWKVIGLDRASPWNPPSDEPTWRYRICGTCDLRFGSNTPSCPRCHADEVGQELRAYEIAGFVARRDESPVLEEEERFATRNLVRVEPQWDGEVTNRWSIVNGWTLRLSRREEIRWVNEGLAPPVGGTTRGPLLHGDAMGWQVCVTCGRLLTMPPPDDNRRSQRRAATGGQGGRDDPFGHETKCERAGTPPVSCAIETSSRSTVLRLLAPLPSAEENDDLRTWGLSLGYALRHGMRRHFLLDGTEIEYELEGPWEAGRPGERFARMALTFIDPSLGGSGFLDRVAEELHHVARRALEHLDHPASNCDTACYRCLKSYANQRFHSLLRWPRIINTLETLAEEPPSPLPLERGDLHDPGPWLEAYRAGVGSPLELEFLQLFEQHGFHPRTQVPVSLSPGQAPITTPDFAVPERQLAIYVDGACFHTGVNLRRDRLIRTRLRQATPPWRVVELRRSDLRRGAQLVRELMEEQRA